MYPFSSHWKVIIASFLLPIFISGCGGIGRRAKNILDDIPTPSTSRIFSEADNIAPVATHSISNADLAESIAVFIRTAGGSPAGRAYVQNKVASASPISRKGLASVIYEELYNELRKTGMSLTQRQLIDLQHTSSVLGNEIIQETSSSNSGIQVTEE